jgi:ribonuclease HI
MTKHEAKNVTGGPHIQIGFWYIPREHNQLADSLAKAAAVQGDVATV